MFQIRERGSTVWREILGGATTFMAMSYILFVQVGLLGEKGVGMDSGGVLMAMCISSAAACMLMGLLANYPVALAPGMGENFVFAGFAGAMAVWGAGLTGWKMALALVMASGALFLLLSTVGFRSYIVNAIPDALKSGIAAGIGLFIAVIGFNNGNMVQAGGGLVVFPGFKDNPAAVVTMIGLAITLALLAFRLHGAILVGILATTGLSMVMGHAHWQTPLAVPNGLGRTAGGFIGGFQQLWQALPGHWVDILGMLFVFLFLDLFDTVGTLVGVAKRAGLMRDGKLPKASAALAADAAGTVIGAGLGSSIVTSYIESITGVQSGARTGLAAIVTGLLLLAAMFFEPLVDMVVGNYVVDGAHKFPVIAPALIIVGAMMLRTIRDIDWEDATEYLPAFLTIIAMPLAYSIAAGIALGFVSYAFGKLVSGRARECPVIVYVFAVVFAVGYAWPACH